MDSETAVAHRNRAVFISYAHADNEGPDPAKHWLDRFLEFVKPLVRQHDLALWSDEDMKIGENWHAAIQSQLETAKAVVLLVSPAFLASDYIADNELPVLLKNASARGVAILPIIISPCLYEQTKFKYPDPKDGFHEFTLASIQSANPPSRTLVEMDEGEQNRVLLKVAERLSELFGAAAQSITADAPGDIRSQVREPSNTVLFDEAHGQGEWWVVSPTLGSGYGRVKAITERTWRTNTSAVGRALTSAALEGHKALILPLGPQKKTLLGDDEIAAIKAFVAHGGGLLVMGAYTGDWHHEANLNKLLQAYGIAFNRDVVVTSLADRFEQASAFSPVSQSAVEARPANAGAQSASASIRAMLLDGVSAVVTLSSCSLYVNESAAVPILCTSSDSMILEPVPIGIGVRIQDYEQRSGGPVIVAAASRSQKVVVVGSWKVFLDDFLDFADHDNARFYENILKWLTR